MLKGCEHDLNALTPSAVCNITYRSITPTEGGKKVMNLTGLPQLRLINLTDAKFYAEGLTCDIERVLTNVGAPKEYYAGKAILVNPRDMDDIGPGIMQAMNDSFSQPELMSFVKGHYSERVCCELLHKYISEVRG